MGARLTEWSHRNWLLSRRYIGAGECASFSVDFVWTCVGGPTVESVVRFMYSSHVHVNRLISLSLPDPESHLNRPLFWYLFVRSRTLLMAVVTHGAL